MTIDLPGALVATDWLAERLGEAGLCIVDATWYLPDAGRSGREDYAAGHIPGAVFWDIDAIADADDPLPHMLPSADAFARAMAALGIANETAVVVYDAHGLMTAARPWWMLRHFGHDRVAVLDGGMPKWRAEGRPIEAAPPAPRPARFVPAPRPAMVRGLAEMRANLESSAEQVVDARAVGRFKGTAPEPRPACRPGHIPGSLNLPFDALLDPETRTVRPPAALRAAFAAAGLDFARPVTTTCGSGVTACVLALGLHLLGKDDVAVYDGSWSEWGGRRDTPVAR